MADPITREQVERAIPESTACNAHGVCKALGELWYRREDVPEDVRAGWGAIGYNDLTAALTRWRDELAAAEPVRRVARWDAERQRYMLTPPATTSHQYNPSTADRETASAWGYEIEGGPEPIQTLSRCPDCGGPRTDMDEHDAWCDDCWGKRCAAHYAATEPAEDSPERLRERREALGWTREEAATRAQRNSDGYILAVEGACMVAKPCPECGKTRARYAAALSAEEARRERPAPRFKVGNWVRVVSNGAVYQVGEIATPFGGMAYYFRETGGAENSWQAAALEPASPPAPEVADVPQPITKRCSLDGADIYATWVMDGGVLDLLFVRDDGEHREPVPLALLRAMLEAIDAQQGGASRLRAAEARTAWQPIETAPVGEWVLICAPGWLAPVMAVHDGECWWMGNDAVSGATHWQPLPATPEAPHV